MLTVFVSGATGFIAQHVVNVLLERKYKVIGSVRSAAKGEKLEKDFNNANFKTVVVPTVAAEGAFDDVFKSNPEIEYFIHMAGPVSLVAENPEKDILEPTLNGTKFALKSAKDHAKNLKRLVFTSSALAMFNPANPTKDVLNEHSWSNITWEQSLLNGMLAYFGSKYFSEKLVWEFFEKEKPHFDFSVINPVYTFGPQLFDSNAKGKLNSSNEDLLVVIKKKGEPIPGPPGVNFIDVRDVALAHVRAFEVKEAAGRRFLLSNTPFSPQIANETIRRLYPELGLPKGNPDEPHNASVSDTAIVKDILGIDMIDFDTSVKDTVDQYLRCN